MSINITIPQIKIHGKKELPCPKCGRKVKRSVTFSRSLISFNEGGWAMSREEIVADLKATRDKWMRTPVLCSRCKKAGGKDA